MRINIGIIKILKNGLKNQGDITLEKEQEEQLVEIKDLDQDLEEGNIEVQVQEKSNY